MMKIIALSGGGIRGAFQVGALSVVLNRGFQADKLYGVSVGALNTALIGTALGKAVLVHGDRVPEERWQRAGHYARSFWIDAVHRPQDLVSPLSYVDVLRRITFRKFESLVGIDPLKRLIQQHIHGDLLRLCPVPIVVGWVDLESGDYCSTDLRERQDWLDVLLASAAIPGVMPPVLIEGRPCADGGLRHVVPPIEEKKSAFCLRIICHAEKLAPSKLSPGSLFSQIDRFVEIITHETISEDIKAPECQMVMSKIIRPKLDLEVSITDFSKETIRQLIAQGMEQAHEVFDYWEI